MPTRRAIISGGGIGGLCAAIALRRVGWEVAVYEAAPGLSEIGAGLTLWPNALHALDHLGLGAATRALGIIDPGGGTIIDHHGKILTTLSTTALTARHGAPIVVVHRAEFQALLADTLGREHLHTGKRLRAYDPDTTPGVVAHFTDGTTTHGDLLIGADGLRSATRRQLLGPRGPQPRYAGYTAWRAIVHYPHAAIPFWGEVWGAGQRAGIAPVGGERVYFFATRNAPPGTDRGGTPEGRKAALRQHFGDWCAPLPALLDALDPASLLQHDIEELPPLPRWGAGAITLLGDAAHAITPNLGQGACLAIEDAVTLAAALHDRSDLPVALRRYEAIRRPRAAQIGRQARLLGIVGQWSQPVARTIRNRAIGLVPAQVRVRAFDTILGWQPPP